MSRSAQFQFVSTEASSVEAFVTEVYERMMGVSVKPASPEKLFCQWVADVVVQLRAEINYTGNQNLPSRAGGEYLDALGSELYMLDRPAVVAAVCTERFHISEAQTSAVLIPAGTRVTDAGAALVWETVEDVYVEIGQTYADVQIRCQTAGTAGNGYGAGRINTFVDLYDYCSRCENLTASEGGSDVPTDEEYYALMRASMDGYSTAGPKGAYEFFAKRVSTQIADVIAASPSPGVAAIYVLMNDGTFAGPELKRAVQEACSQDTRRPMTDKVQVEDGERVSYDIDFTYYIQRGGAKSAAAVEEDVKAAVERYKAWQAGRFGRDINPDKLREHLFQAGVKRVVLRSPEFTPLKNGATPGDTPQVAGAGQVTIVNGGYEDE